MTTVLSYSWVLRDRLSFFTNFAGQTKLFRGTIQTKIKHTLPSEICRRVVLYTQPSPATVINHSHVCSYSRTSLDKSMLRPAMSLAHQIANRWCQVSAFVNTTRSTSWYRWHISYQVVMVLPTGRKFGLIKQKGAKKIEWSEIPSAELLLLHSNDLSVPLTSACSTCQREKV